MPTTTMTTELQDRLARVRRSVAYVPAKPTARQLRAEAKRHAERERHADLRAKLEAMSPEARAEAFDNPSGRPGKRTDKRTPTAWLPTTTTPKRSPDSCKSRSLDSEYRSVPQTCDTPAYCAARRVGPLRYNFTPATPFAETVEGFEWEPEPDGPAGLPTSFEYGLPRRDRIADPRRCPERGKPGSDATHWPTETEDLPFRLEVGLTKATHGHIGADGCCKDCGRRYVAPPAKLTADDLVALLCERSPKLTPDLIRNYAAYRPAHGEPHPLRDLIAYHLRWIRVRYGDRLTRAVEAEALGVHEDSPKRIKRLNLSALLAALTVEVCEDEPKDDRLRSRRSGDGWITTVPDARIIELP